MTVYPFSLTDHFYNLWPVFRFTWSLYCNTPSHGFLIDIDFVHLFAQDWGGDIVEFRMMDWGGSLPTHHCLKVPLQGLLVDCFGQEVGGLFRSFNVVDGDLPSSHVIKKVVQTNVQVIGSWPVLVGAGAFQSTLVVLKYTAVNFRIGQVHFDAIALHLFEEFYNRDSIS